MNRVYRHLQGLMLGALLLAGSGTVSYAKNWEPLKSEPSDLKTVVKESEVEIKTSSGTIVITSPQPVQVKVFTILGQKVSDGTVGPGIVRLQVGSHGVYIIKVGERTVKVAL